MRIGIVADIHEHIDELRLALDAFRQRGVDTVVNLGDACDFYSRCGRAAEVVALLKSVEAVGVWGNHDFGLCHQVPDAVREKTAPEMLAYMGTMQARLVVGDCHFSHVEPWLDPYSVE
jgi:predicted phosphodiesterase